MRRVVAFAAFAVLAPLGWGQSASSVAIELPKDARVTLEVDAQDDDLLAVIRQFFNFPTQTGKTSVSFPLGGRQFDIQDVSALLKNVHRLHAITYTSAAGPTEAMSFQESALSRDGFRRMVYTPNMGLLIMRRAGQGGMGIVFCHGQEVTVARTDGMIDMSRLGKVAQDVFRGMVMPSASELATPAVATPAAAPAKVKKRIVVSPAKVAPKTPTKQSGG